MPTVNHFQLKIGTTDITNLIAFQGLKWSRNDIDSPNAGRTLDGVMHRGRVTTKIRLDVTFRIMTQAEHNALLTAINPETITLTYYDPMSGTRTATFYANNNTSEYCIMKPNGTEYWHNVQVAFVEV